VHPRIHPQGHPRHNYPIVFHRLNNQFFHHELTIITHFSAPHHRHYFLFSQ